MRIRSADVSDSDGITKVRIDTWRTAYAGIVPDAHLAGMSYELGAARWRQSVAERDPREFTLVAVDPAEQIIGFASGGPEREGDPVYCGEVYAIYVLADQQRRGTGRGLMADAARRLLASGFKTMLVWVLAQNRSRGFYETLGGWPIREKIISIGGTALVEVAYAWDDIGPLAEREPAADGTDR